MMTESLIAEFLIFLGIAVPSLATGFFLRRKRRVDITLAVSGDNREWAEMFVARAEKAELRAERAEAQLAELRVRIERLEADRESDQRRVATWTAYTRTLIALLREHNIPHPDPPAEWQD